MPVYTRIQVRRDTEAAWTSANPVLASGEFGLETDSDAQLKIGNGSTAWSSLAYFVMATAGGAVTVANGLTVTAGGLTVTAGTTAVQALTATTGVFSGVVAAIGAAFFGGNTGDYPRVGHNMYTYGGGANTFKYLGADYAAAVHFLAGGINFLTAPSGAANAAITFTTALSIAQTGAVTVAGSIILATSSSPASNGAGTAGQIAWDASYIYVCTATNTWKRAALTGGY